MASALSIVGGFQYALVIVCTLATLFVEVIGIAFLLLIERLTLRSYNIRCKIVDDQESGAIPLQNLRHREGYDNPLAEEVLKEEETQREEQSVVV